MLKDSEPLVALHVFPTTGREELGKMFDNGRIIDGLAARGIGHCISSRQTWDTETPGKVRFIEGDGLGEGVVDPQQIGAIYSRLIAPITKPLGVEKQTLNPNKLKRLNKQDLHEFIPNDYKIPTSFIGLTPEKFDEATQAIEAMAEDTTELVMKSSGGFGGQSTKFFERESAIEWLRNNLDESGSEKTVLLQPRVEHGRLPNSIKGHTLEDEERIRTIRTTSMPCEIRMFVLKNKGVVTTVPILRSYHMESGKIITTADDYIDIELGDELEGLLSNVSTSLIEELARRYQTGDYMIAALDYVFDKEGTIKLMDFNTKSPTPPRTIENPKAGRQVNDCIVDILTTMVEQQKGGE